MGSYFADGSDGALIDILSAMKWYMVTKTIGGRPYLYRQRTYREGGKVRTQSQYVGAASENARSDNARSGTVDSETGPVSTIATQAAPEAVFATLPQTPALEINPEQPDLTSTRSMFEEDLPEPGTLPINWENAANPFWPSIRRFHAEQAKPALRRDQVSLSAMKAEYARVGSQLDHLGLDGAKLGKVRLLEGKKAGWRRYKSGYHVTLAKSCTKAGRQTGSGRNRFKRHYRVALAHALLDEIEDQSPSLYDGLRTIIDRSWFNTKMLVTLQILRDGKGNKGKGSKNKNGGSSTAGRALMVMQFLWSGQVPKAMETSLRASTVNRKAKSKTGIDTSDKRDWKRSAGWRDEAATLIADVMQRSYQPSLKKLAQDRSKAGAKAKRAMTAYRKLNPLQRMTSKGRKRWKTYKRHEAAYLLAYHRQSRLEVLKPFLGDFHKGRRGRRAKG